MPNAIQAEGLSKKYLIDHLHRDRYQTLRESIIGGARDMVRRSVRRLSGEAADGDGTEEFWALRDVSFEVPEGARVGIIGRNGAGKSTLLKILSRITEPTAGRVRLRGRVASLLEVGTGFHPELTGRENIYLNGAILGMSHAEIQRKFDEIVAFAEIERFLDTPVKRYSSGMYVRLAFAVAAHLEPEILIVDEVLAVGDMAFQKKCLGKMDDVSKAGRTVLFVSHNLATITALCDQAMLLEQGHVVASGQTQSVIDAYLARQSTVTTTHHYRNRMSPEQRGEAELCELQVVDAHGNPQPVLLVDEPFSLQIIWRLNVDVQFLRLGIDIIDHAGRCVVSSMDTDTTGLHGKPRERGTFREDVSIPAFLLMPGTYTVNVFAGIPRVARIMEVNAAVGFEILENNTHLSHLTAVRRDGFTALPLTWKVEHETA